MWARWWYRFAPLAGIQRPFHHVPVTWLWQVILVGIGLALGAEPLRTLVRQYSEHPPVDHPEPAAAPVG